MAFSENAERSRSISTVLPSTLSCDGVRYIRRVGPDDPAAAWNMPRRCRCQRKVTAIASCNRVFQCNRKIEIPCFVVRRIGIGDIPGQNLLLTMGAQSQCLALERKCVVESIGHDSSGSKSHSRTRCNSRATACPTCKHAFSGDVCRHRRPRRQLLPERLKGLPPASFSRWPLIS